LDFWILHPRCNLQRPTKHEPIKKIEQTREKESTWKTTEELKLTSGSDMSPAIMPCMPAIPGIPPLPGIPPPAEAGAFLALASSSASLFASSCAFLI
jgi:hypothetical protein